MPEQRYVSAELTHFLGRGLREDDRYRLLVDILRGGELTGSDGILGDEPVSIDFDLVDEMTDGEVCSANRVCFCDIPVDELGIHIGKYGRFGIAFRKSFLVSRGACPVHYVPTEFRLHYRALMSLLERDDPECGAPCADLYREALRCFLLFSARFCNPRMAWEEDAGRSERERWGHALRTIGHLLCMNVFPFLKFFDHARDDDDSSNFYMEREWRVLGNVQFPLHDVCRVILPQEYAERLRDEVPGYVGEITFAP